MSVLITIVKESETVSHSVVSDSFDPCLASLPMEVSKQQYWVAIPFSRGSS